MDKYLLEILKEVNTIIIPGLGALTITNTASGEIMFMPYLKFDDGKLTEYISKKDGIAENDAKNLIAKYVREVEAKINTGESYDMFQFGSFVKNASGDIDFKQWDNQNNSTELDSTQKIDSTTTADALRDDLPTEDDEKNSIIISLEPTSKKEDPREEQISSKDLEDNNSKRDDLPDEIGDEEKTSPKKAKKTTKKDAVQEITPIVESTAAALPKQQIVEENDKENIHIDEVVATEYVPEIPLEKEEATSSYTIEDQWKDDLEVPPIGATIERPKKPIVEKMQKDKKKRRPAFYILLVLAVLLIAGTLTVGMFYNSLEKFLPFMSNVAHEKVDEKELTPTTEEKTQEISKDTTTIESADESVNEQIEEANTKPEEKSVATSSGSEFIQTSTGLVDPSKPFHIVGGAFSDKANADRYLAKLTNSGQPAIMIGQFDNLYIVSIASYSSNVEAQNALSTSRSISSNAWIFQWP